MAEQKFADSRWKGIERPYTAADVARLRGSVRIEYTLARLGAEKFWKLLQSEPVVAGLGCVTGNQAVQTVQAGLKSIYCSGWQVAGDGNSAGEMYPDQSLYPVDSVPKMVERINNALLRTDQIHHLSGKPDIDWMVPIIADAEAGFGGNLNAFELTKALIRAGAAGVHFEDQLSSAKKCGHLGGKVLVSTQEAVNKLVAARLAADVLDVPTFVISRTDADAADLLLSDHDPRDREFLTGERSVEGFFYVRPGMDQAIARGLAYAPYSDLIWCETSKPDLAQALKRGLAALVPAFFTFGGWQQALWIAGEVRDPRRTLPRAIVGGVLAVVVVYLLANWAYLRLLGVQGVAGSHALAAATLGGRPRFRPQGVQWSQETLDGLPGLCLHDLMLLPVEKKATVRARRLDRRRERNRRSDVSRRGREPAVPADQITPPGGRKPRSARPACACSAAAGGRHRRPRKWPRTCRPSRATAECTSFAACTGA